MNIDYQIVFDTNYYSVPYNLVHELGGSALEPHHGRDLPQEPTGAVAPARMRSWAYGHDKRAPPPVPPGASGMDAVAHGALTAQLVRTILESKPHPEMGYRSCLGLTLLAGQYSSSRMEAASERALASGTYRYQVLLKLWLPRRHRRRRQHRVQPSMQRAEPCALNRGISAGGRCPAPEAR